MEATSQWVGAMEEVEGEEGTVEVVEGVMVEEGEEATVVVGVEGMEEEEGVGMVEEEGVGMVEGIYKIRKDSHPRGCHPQQVEAEE